MRRVRSVGTALAAKTPTRINTAAMRPTRFSEADLGFGVYLLVEECGAASFEDFRQGPEESWLFPSLFRSPS